jgi:parallel beta-helix repeat protein
MYSMTDSGIAVKGSNAANTLVYNNIFQSNYIAVNLTQSSTSNTIYGNTISYNNIGLSLKSGGNTIYANTISQNNIGIKLQGSNDNIIYWNNFDNYVQQVDIQSSISAWDNGYPMGGNYWSNYAGQDVYSGPNRDQPGSDGLGDTPRLINDNNRDNYPLMKPFGGSHDIGIIQVTCLKTIVGQGYVMKIEVTVLSYGIYTETRNIKIYANTLVATGQDVSLTFRHSTTITFTWDTTSFAKGNYNIKAYATPITDDVDIDDNTRQDGTVLVTIAGDVNGDKIVNAFDLYLLGKSYGATPGSPNWNPNADINNNQIINKPDLQIISQNYGKSF